MAIITTREIGATAIQIPLSNAQLDNNFINLNADIATRVPASEKGAVNGVATLDASGLVPTAQLPSYVDDVLEAANFEAFPASGETGKIYVALDTNKTYRWSGSAYIYITSGAVDSVAGKTGVVTLVKADVGLANVDNTSDADKPVSTATQTALNTKQAALGYTPVNKAGDTITGDLLNSAAYSAPNSESGAGTRLRIRGSTGTGAAGAAGGNGYVEILGGGATSAWESFAGSATRGGVLVQSGTAQGDAGNTYVAGSSLQLRAGAGTTNGTQVGFGGTVNIYAGNTTRTDGNTSSGGGLTLWGGRGTQSGYFALGGGVISFPNFASSQSGGISSYPGTATEGGETNISGGSFSTGAAQSYTNNTGGYIVLKGATATTGGDIAFYPGSVYEGIAGGVNGTVKVNNNIVLHAGNYSSYAQPLLVSGTTIKTINGTSVLGSGDIVISAAASGVTAFNTRSGAVTLSSSDVTEALGYTPLSSSGGTLSGVLSFPQNPVGTTYGNGESGTPPFYIGQVTGDNDAWKIYGESASTNTVSLIFEINDDLETAGKEWVFRNKKTYTDYLATEPFVISGAGAAFVAGNAVLHAGNYSSYVLPLSGGTLTGKIILPSAIADRPQLFGGFLGMDSGDADVDIWGISRDYYPSNGTAANAWGIAWNAEANQIRFIGGGNTRLSIDLDGGASGLAWDGNAVLNSSNYTDYAAAASHTHSYLPLTGGTVTGNTTIGRDLYISGESGGSYGNRLVVGNTSTAYTLQDTNIRPTIQIHGAYPVLSLNHTVENGNHGPTIQFTSNGAGNQFVVGTNGTGTQLFMGYSANSEWNPHSGIAGYQGTSFFEATTDGYIGIGAPGNWGGMGGGNPGYHLHFKGYNNATGGYAAVFRNTADAVTGGGFLFQSDYGNHSYGIVAEFRVGDSGSSDRPSILFSSALTSTTWSVGYGYYDDQFRIKQNHGHRNSDWGTERFRIDTDGIAYFNGNVALHAGNYSSYALPLSGGNISGSVNINAGNADGSNDASLYITATNNTDWGLIVNKYNADATEYGVDIRVGSSANYALRINGNGGEVLRVTGAGNLISTGTISAASKSFLIPHPTKPGLQLRYGSLEGPENGVYVRGKLKGINKIQLPEYWTKLVDPDSITVTLTPVGKHQRLYVESIADNTVTVANDGLFAGEINCFFVVYAERVDIDKLVVECE